jgi:hypothetical protein
VPETTAPIIDASALEAAGPTRVWPPVVLALGCAAAYAVIFVVPYYVNVMDRFPLEDVAIGYHDPKDLWPYDTGLAYFFGMGGLLMVRLGVVAVLTALVWSVTLLVRHRAHLGGLRRGALVLAAGVAVGTLVWRASTFGQALTRWWLD